MMTAVSVRVSESSPTGPTIRVQTVEMDLSAPIGPQLFKQVIAPPGTSIKLRHVVKPESAEPSPLPPGIPRVFRHAVDAPIQATA